MTEVEQPIDVDEADESATPTGPMSEQMWTQLLEFSQATRNITTYLDGEDASLDGALQRLNSYGFGPRQVEYFRHGLETLFERRRVVAEAKQQYQERYGEEWQRRLFCDLFGTSGTFGTVELYPDQSNLVFLCHDDRDMAQGLEPDFDAYRKFQTGELGETELAEAGEQTPVGIYMLRPERSLEGIGSLTGAFILINLEEVDARAAASPNAQASSPVLLSERDALLLRVIHHEQQHAENSLYHRPRFTEYREARTVMAEAADRLEPYQAQLAAISGRIKSEIARREQANGMLYPREVEATWRELLTPEEIEQLLTIGRASLTEIGPLAERVTAQLTRNAVEGLVKEELLAFHLSGSANDEIDDALPMYLLHLKQVIMKLRATYASILLAHFPDFLLEELGMTNAQHQRDMGPGTFRLGNDPILRRYPDDRVSAAFLPSYEVLRRFEAQFRSEVDRGRSLLQQIEEFDRAHGSHRSAELTPLLISQPLERWDRLIRQSLRATAEQPPAEGTSE